MPILSVFEEDLFIELKDIGISSEADFERVSFEFGLELDEVTSEYEQKRKECGERAAVECSHDRIYKIEIPANRNDLLCLEGVCQALRVFCGTPPPPRRGLTRSAIKCHLSRELNGIRPYFVSAVLKDIQWDHPAYKRFIDFQDKLHQNVCRKRDLVSIGTHDLDKIRGTHIRVLAQKPEDIEFVPLNLEESLTGPQIRETYSTHLQLKEYLPLLERGSKWPILYDESDQVLSLPPLINSDATKISAETRNIFIDVTATDLTKAEIVLETLCLMFERYCQPGGGIQQVWVDYEENEKVPTGCWYPQFKLVSFEVDPNLLKKRVLGHTDMTTEKVQAYLEKMSLTSSPKGDLLVVQVPPWRHDIFHVCDIVEDFAISYGYSNLVPSVPHLPTFGRKNAKNSMTDSLRLTLSQLGLTEALNFVLVGGEAEHLPDISPVTLANSRSLDFQSVRTSLIPGLIKTFASNNHRRKPQKLFEVGDVCRVVDGVPLNFRRFAVCILDNWTQDMQSSMQQIQEVLDTLMEKLGCLSQVALQQQELQGAQNVKPKKLNSTASKKSFRVIDGEHTWFLPRCRGDVLMDNQCIGHIGTLSPDFTAQFRVTLPVLCLELELTAFDRS